MKKEQRNVDGSDCLFLSFRSQLWTSMRP